MTNKMLESIKKDYTLKKVDAGVFTKLTIQGAAVRTEAYDIEGLGRVSAIRLKCFFGFLKMDTLIINPLEKDMPIYYYNRLFAKGADTYRVELLDSQLAPVSLDALSAIKERYGHIADEMVQEKWYDEFRLPESTIKKASKKMTSEIDTMAMEYMEAYMEVLKEAPSCKATQKKKKALSFVNGLAKQGGMSVVDIFIANYGEKITSKLCHEVLFGI